MTETARPGVVKLSLPALYPILNVRGRDDADFDRVRRTALALAHAGTTWIQLRAKDLPSGLFFELAFWCAAHLRDAGCKVIINDRVDVAMAARAAGVHLGDEDIPVEAARRLLGPDAVIGYSTHTVEEIAAAPQAADYVGFGPVFESPTKAGARSARGLELLARACRASTRPVVAIGGVTLASAPDLWKAGAASGAVISEVERTSDIAALVQAWAESNV